MAIWHERAKRRLALESPLLPYLTIRSLASLTCSFKYTYTHTLALARVVCLVQVLSINQNRLLFVLLINYLAGEISRMKTKMRPRYTQSKDIELETRSVGCGSCNLVRCLELHLSRGSSESGCKLDMTWIPSDC